MNNTDALNELIIAGQSWEQQCIMLLNIFPSSTLEHTHLTDSLKKLTTALEKLKKRQKEVPSE